VREAKGLYMQTDPPKYKVIKTAENAWQVYALKETKNDGTYEYERMPDYRKTRSLIWFITEEAARDWAEENV
jgi:hypothetical protein